MKAVDFCGFQPGQIATSLSGSSILQTLLVIFIFPWLQHRFGTLTIYRSAMTMFVLLVACYPLVHLIAKSATKRHHGGHRNDFLPQDQSDHLEVFREGTVGTWDGVPSGVIIGISGMMIIKAFGGLTWG